MLLSVNKNIHQSIKNNLSNDFKLKFNCTFILILLFMWVVVNREHPYYQTTLQLTSHQTSPSHHFATKKFKCFLKRFDVSRRIRSIRANVFQTLLVDLHGLNTTRITIMTEKHMIKPSMEFKTFFHFMLWLLGGAPP